MIYIFYILIYLPDIKERMYYFVSFLLTKLHCLRVLHFPYVTHTYMGY